MRRSFRWVTSRTPSSSTSSSSSRELSLATAEGEWTLRVVAQPKRTIVAAVPAPPLGWTSVRPVRVPGTVPGTCPNVDVSSLTRIVRGKDIGDSYNYAPPADDVLVDVPTDERIERVEDGPLRRVDVLHRTYVWDDRSVETRTRFEQRAGESFVRVRLELDNTCDDQRVRVHVPLLEPAESSHAEGQFAVVERSLEVEGGHGEVAVPTFPASGVRRRGRDRASPRPRHRVRGRRRRARADRAALDRLHQPQREPVARRAGRPRDPDSGGTTPRPPFLLVRVLPERRLDRRTRRGVPPSLLDRARYGGGRSCDRRPALRSKATAEVILTAFLNGSCADRQRERRAADSPFCRPRTGAPAVGDPDDHPLRGDATQTANAAKRQKRQCGCVILCLVCVARSCGRCTCLRWPRRHKRPEQVRRMCSRTDRLTLRDEEVARSDERPVLVRRPLADARVDVPAIVARRELAGLAFELPRFLEPVAVAAAARRS